MRLNNKTYRDSHKDERKAYKKKYDEANRERKSEYNKAYAKLNEERRKEKITCDCGGHFLKRTIRCHERSKMHQQYLQNQNNHQE